MSRRATLEERVMLWGAGGGEGVARLTTEPLSAAGTALQIRTGEGADID